MPLLSIEGKRFRVGDLAGSEATWTVQVDEKTIEIEILEQNREILLVRTGGRVMRIAVEQAHYGDAYLVELNGRQVVARIKDEAAVSSESRAEIESGPALVTSPMAGKIASVKVEIGAVVEEGQALVFLEAMKMENEIASPKKGTVKEIYVEQGSLAKPGDKLVLVE